jgi:hypothetical protein
MTEADYCEASSKALSLFEYGQVSLFFNFLFFFLVWFCLVKPNGSDCLEAS